ncbi:MAG: hypothetical protein ACR2GY_00510 [Phycisphaerales bacterium]
MPAFSTVFIHTGDLPAHVALSLEGAQAARACIWIPPGVSRRAAAAAKRSAAHHQATLVIDEHASEHVLTQLPASHMLLSACERALAERVRRIVWPVSWNDDLEAMSRAIELAQLVSAAARLERSATHLTIDLPVVDLSDRQLADLFDDGNLPADGFWPCEAVREGNDESAPACNTCSSCQRWNAALAACGIRSM